MTYRVLEAWVGQDVLLGMPLPSRVRYVRMNLAALNPRAREPWMSQPEFAAAVGVSDRSVVSKWERAEGGVTPRNVAPRIAALTPYPPEAFGADGEAELVRLSLGSRLEQLEAQTTRDAIRLRQDLALLLTRIQALERRDEGEDQPETETR